MVTGSKRAGLAHTCRESRCGGQEGGGGLCRTANTESRRLGRGLAQDGAGRKGVSSALEVRGGRLGPRYLVSLAFMRPLGSYLPGHSWDRTENSEKGVVKLTHSLPTSKAARTWVFGHCGWASGVRPTLIKSQSPAVALELPLPGGHRGPLFSELTQLAPAPQGLTLPLLKCQGRWPG